MEYEIDMTDMIILSAFQDEDIMLDKAAFALTVVDVVEHLQKRGLSKCRKTVYLHLTKLEKSGYVEHGIKNKTATSYFITEKGKKTLKGDF
jgi:repressor of nif and glnA expression